MGDASASTAWLDLMSGMTHGRGRVGREGKALDIPPRVVLIVTALGGIVGGIVGLILAVPFFVIARDAMARLRSRGVVERVTTVPNRPCTASSNERVDGTRQLSSGGSFPMSWRFGRGRVR